MLNLSPQTTRNLLHLLLTDYMDDSYDSITKSKGKMDLKSKKMKKVISTVKMYLNKQTLAFGYKNMVIKGTPFVIRIV